MQLFTGMWLTIATTGKPNAYLTMYINSCDIILKIYQLVLLNMENQNMDFLLNKENY